MGPDSQMSSPASDVDIGSRAGSGCLTAVGSWFFGPLAFRKE